MINKKLLAASIAAAFTFNAQAVVNLDADSGKVTIAAETVAGTDVSDGTVSTSGLVVLTDAGTALDVATKVGFSIAKGTSKYVRFDIANGEFQTITDIDDGINTAVTVVSAGGAGKSFAVFELAADVNTTTAATVLTLDATYAMTNKSALSITYKLFETAQEAVNNTTNGLATSNGVIAEIKSAVTGTFSTEATAQAKVASQFKDFDGVGGTTGNLNVITVAALDAAGPWLFPDTATAFTDANLATGSAKVAFSGDFSFGTFSYNGATWSVDKKGAFVGTGTAVKNTDGSVSVSYGASTFAVDLVDTDTVTDAAVKGTYTAVLSGVTVTGVASPVNKIGSFTEASGKITYDTTSISVPYLTTFSSYNQRIYIVNQGGQDASYTTSFVSESGITAVAGTKATGVIPAGKMMVIKATDLVTLTGGTRTSATIEIEAQNTKVIATSQSVNLTNGSTDTTALYGELNTKN